MAVKDGDGWAVCDQGHRHWGLYGASGLLAVHFDDEGTPHVLMQKRSGWSHHGGTWGLPGGALDSHEDAVAGALREALEEAALAADELRILGVHLDDHGGWSFATVIAEAATLLPAAPANGESTAMRWLRADEIAGETLRVAVEIVAEVEQTGAAVPVVVEPVVVESGGGEPAGGEPAGGETGAGHAEAGARDDDGRDPGHAGNRDAGEVLHPGFAHSWPQIKLALPPSVVVLDAANIVGARAEHGWWRDRAGAARRLLADVEELARRGLRPPEGFPAPARWFPRLIMVVEGAARGLRSQGPVTAVDAPGNGDDAIVETVREIRTTRPWERVLVVTADRELRRRVRELGAEVTGPSWLLGQLQRV
ncbi:NUDIX domain-containing protein [Sphaerisporangium sp. TRM90804]|uniref:NUDIX domain-containing protein n=1 Tax=Sphaerisporangium sp. TRM90804 TaxID=3031113 RepID=UPI002449A2AC|nr:NUDIX domain-containing protein [Sphaerisporangium sp. TRM90804]MDH2425712.1 NUDIX domain-containing protein [Sphaerisporangium sp. TRM90804]